MDQNNISLRFANIAVIGSQKNQSSWQQLKSLNDHIGKNEDTEYNNFFRWRFYWKNFLLTS